MKTFLKSIYLAVFIGYVSSGTVVMAETSSSYSFNKLSSSLCEKVKNNQLIKFRRALTKARTHIRNIYPDVKCDGQSLLSLAMENQSDSIVGYLKQKANPESHASDNYIVSN